MEVFVVVNMEGFLLEMEDFFCCKYGRLPFGNGRLCCCKYGKYGRLLMEIFIWKLAQWKLEEILKRLPEPNCAPTSSSSFAHVFLKLPI